MRIRRRMFKKAGYEVSLLRGRRQFSISSATFAKFEDSAATPHRGVSNAGHGIEIGGTTYVIPVDAKLASDR